MIMHIVSQGMVDVSKVNERTALAHVLTKKLEDVLKPLGVIKVKIMYNPQIVSRDDMKREKFPEGYKVLLRGENGERYRGFHKEPYEELEGNIWRIARELM